MTCVTVTSSIIRTYVYNLFDNLFDNLYVARFLDIKIEQGALSISLFPAFLLCAPRFLLLFFVLHATSLGTNQIEDRKEMAPTKYHRFRQGERCDECGARQWYAQDAIRYCRNGHRLEGFAEHEGDEDAFGTQGKVSRRKKEARKKVAVKLTGDEGRELYLEVLQLILLKQVWWLVKEKGFPDDFEEIVRALWTLRVRNLPLQESGEEKKKGREGSDWEQDGFSSSAGSTLFSSQSEGTGFESSDFDHSDATTATWAPDASKRWKLPKLFDTLSLCYLGCLVRRLPATTADFCSWAQKGEIDFLAAVCY